MRPEHRGHAPRNNDLAKIHIAKKDLGLDDDTYRQMLWTVARVKSSSDLDEPGRRRVLDHLRGLGWKASTRKARRKNFPGRPHNCDEHRQLLKIEAQLADMKLPWSYADGIARQMFGKDKVAFCTSGEWQSIITALSREQRRRGNA